MRKVLTGMMLAGAATLSGCATYDDGRYAADDGRYVEPSYADGGRDNTVRGAVTGAAVGAAAGAIGGAVIGGVSPVEGAIAGAVVGGVVGAIAADNDGDGYPDNEYYDRNGDGYYDGKYYESGRPMHVKPKASYRRSGERG